MVTKNRATNASRRGDSLSSILWVVPDSLTISPAKNAPRANDSPTACVTAAVAKPKASTTRR